MYPNRPELLDLLPQPDELTLAKLAEGGGVMMDNCEKARLERKLVAEEIRKAGRAMGLSEEKIKVFEMSCFHHLSECLISKLSLIYHIISISVQSCVVISIQEIPGLGILP
jgi:hypothetical protein